MSTFACDICSFTSESSKGLHVHRKKIHGITQYYNCPTCIKIFTKKSHYDRHVIFCASSNANANANITNNTTNSNNTTTSITNNTSTSTTNNMTNSNNQVMNGDVININIVCQKESDFEKLIPITSEAIRKATNTIFKHKSVKTVSDMAVNLFDTCFKTSLITSDASRGTVVWKDGDDGNKKIKDPKAKILTDKTIEAGRDVACKYSKDLSEKFSTLDPKSLDYEYDQISINARYLLAAMHAKGDKSYKTRLSSSLSKLPAANTKYAVPGPTKLIDDKQSILSTFRVLLADWIKQNLTIIFYNSHISIGQRLKEEFALEVDEEKQVVYVVDDSSSLCPLTAKQFGKLFYWCSYNTMELLNYDERIALRLDMPQTNIEEVLKNERDVLLWQARKDPTEHFITELFSGFFLE